MKRVFIIHGWDGSLQEGWFPWLKSELEKGGFAVTVPMMPHAKTPTIEDWVGTLAQVVGMVDKDTYFVGHSIGCQAILRYLAGLEKGAEVGGAVFVAGWFTLTNNDDPETAEPWLTTSIDTDRVKKIIRKSAAIFSETDRFVGVENKKFFEERLGSAVYMEKSPGELGHFSGSDGVTEFPLVLKLITGMSHVDNSYELSTIGIEDLARVEIKIGKILTAEKVEGADRLLKFTVDFGLVDGEAHLRTIVSGVAQYYSPEEMVGRQVPVVTNLAPRKIKGIESNGMIIYAIDNSVNLQQGEALVDGVAGHKPVMLNPEKEVPPGSLVQ